LNPLDLDRDVAALRAAVRNFTAFADSGLFTELEKLFAAELHLDYSSLNGSEPALISASALMQQWASVLPGFDLTFHELSDVQIKHAADHAELTANVCAEHFIADLFWRVRGSYDFRFRREHGRWLIDALRFNLRDESGSREVFGPAIAAAQQKAARQPAV